jgi:Bacterial PH domain
VSFHCPWKGEEKTGDEAMIDFKNAAFLHLGPVDNSAFEAMISPILIAGEVMVGAFQSIRDGVVFTNKRIITINVQGLTGKKKDFTSIPYSKIQVFSVESAGTFDLDSELDVWISGVGRIKLAFSRKADIAGICRLISDFALR